MARPIRAIRSWHLQTEREPLRGILVSQRDNGFPNGTRRQSARLRRRKGQGKIAKSTARTKETRGQGQAIGTRRPRASSQEPRCQKPPTERGCKAQGLEGTMALRRWGFDGSKARGHGRSPWYLSSVFRRKGRSPR
jgi:hypothetical protein